MGQIFINRPYLLSNSWSIAFGATRGQIVSTALSLAASRNFFRWFRTPLLCALAKKLRAGPETPLLTPIPTPWKNDDDSWLLNILRGYKHKKGPILIKKKSNHTAVDEVLTIFFLTFKWSSPKVQIIRATVMNWYWIVTKSSSAGWMFETWSNKWLPGPEVPERLKDMSS